MSLLRSYSGHFQYDPRLGNFKLTPTNLSEILTNPSDKPDKKIDYLLFFPGESSFLFTKEKVLDLRISDHRPVLSSLIINQ
jgi:hypothetical protein